MGILDLLTALSAILWLIILLLPWQPWRNNEVLSIDDGTEPGKEPDQPLSDTSVVIPARNEAPIICQNLSALVGQGPGLRVLLVDDNSTDGTAEVAQMVPGLHVQVIQGEPLVDGWTGKLWALEQGVRKVETPLTLMLDADIALAHGVILALKAQMRRGQYHFVSVMASLNMESFWEKLLNPSFIYFFKMLYPFRLAKTNSPHFYSAAGGCIMMDTQVLPTIGGLASIRGELIDDCALARQVKRARFRTWIGQSRAVTSLRSYKGLGEIWNMVARSAYTQLRYSPWVLLATSFFLITLFVVPVLGWLSPESWVRWLSVLALATMVVSYLPTLYFYRLSPLWASLMPLVGTLYLGMTWSSALRYWRGEHSQWKGRVYR